MNPLLKSSGWIDVKRSGRACEACGRLDTYCTRTVDGTAVKCRRVESKRPIDQIDGTTAWFHWVSELGGIVAASTVKPKEVKKMTRGEIESLLKKFRQQMTPKRLSGFAKEISVSEKSLLAYGAGYDAETGCMSAPMYDGTMRPIGIHLRAPKGSQLDRAGYGKMSVNGSSNGLFIPGDYSDEGIPDAFAEDTSPLLLLTPEGLSDCCACHDYGFRAIGRPSNVAGANYLIDLLGRKGACKQDLVVMGEREETKWHPSGIPYWPGIEGPLAIIGKVLEAKVCHRVRFFIPPEGAGKDFRQWATEKGDGIATVLIGVYDSPVVSTAWLAAAKRRLEKRRVDERKESEFKGSQNSANP